jgi:hypothetical protein
MKLTKDVHDAIWTEYKSCKEVRFYMDKWHVVENDNYWENFTIVTKDSGDIDLLTTLHSASTVDGND